MKNYPGSYALYAGENLEGWRTDRRPWGVGNDGRIGNLLEKTQCERGDISQTRRIYFSNRTWTDQTFWRRSGTVNTHLDTGTPNSRRKSEGFSWRLKMVSCSTTSRLTSGCRWSDKMTSGPCQETSYTAITLNPESSFTRREKNHSLFY